MRFARETSPGIQGVLSLAGLLLGLAGWWFLPGGIPENDPKHLRADVNWEEVAGSQAAFQFHNPDTAIIHQMYLLKAPSGTPLLYYSDIHTPVCIDGVCKPVYVEMYWDLLGNYVGYGEYPNRPLTKYDHDVFLTEDHEKLQDLLLDRNSILDRKSLDDLYDLRGAAGERIEYNGIEIDGISGATKSEIKSSIVSGALYSCFRLWNLAHGDASQKVRENLPIIYSGALAKRFLTSDFGAYRYYAVRQLEGSDFADFGPILRVFERGNPLTRKHILKKIPDSLMVQSHIHTPFYQMFSVLDGSSKTLLLEKLSLAPAAAPSLSSHLDKMTKNQLRTYLEHLKTSPESLPLEARSNLELGAKNKAIAHAYLITQFLAAH
jgi:hypothetical protein